MFISLLLAAQLNGVPIDAAIYLNDTRVVLDPPSGSVIRFDESISYHRVEEQRLENMRATSAINVIESRARGELRFRAARDELQVQLSAQWRPFNERNCTLRQISFTVDSIPFEQEFNGPNDCRVKVALYELEF